MKKIFINLFATFAVVCMLVTATSAAAITGGATLYKGQGTVISDPIGLGTECDYTFQNSSGSEAAGIGKVQAAWSGWPYTEEAHIELPIGTVKTHTETQSKSSSFRGVLNCSTRKATMYLTMRID